MRTIAVALVIYWLATQPEPKPSTTLAWSLVPVRLPQVAPPAATRPSCPPPRTDAAPLPKGTELPHGVNQVMASSTNAGWLAAWNEEHVQVSFDGGRTFKQVLDGIGDVDDVTFDCFGRVIVLREMRVGIREAGRETWQPIPGSHAILVGGGPDVVAVYADNDKRGVLAVSSDAARTWWYRDLTSYWESADGVGVQHADGSLDIKLHEPDCDQEPTFAYHVTSDGHVTREDLGYVSELRPNVVVDRARRTWRIAETIDGEDSWLVYGASSN